MAPFDPYHIWLGIPETARAVSKYRLFANADFELERGVISAATEQQTVYLTTLQCGEHAAFVSEPGAQMMTAGLSTFLPAKDDL